MATSTSWAEPFKLGAISSMGATSAVEEEIGEAGRERGEEEQHDAPLANNVLKMICMGGHMCVCVCTSVPARALPNLIDQGFSARVLVSASASLTSLLANTASLHGLILFSFCSHCYTVGTNLTNISTQVILAAGGG